MLRLPRALLFVLPVVIAGTAVSCASDDERAARVDQRQVPRASSVDPAALSRLERRVDARVGVFALDTGSGRAVAHRADERFPFASTFKALAAGITLRRASDAELAQIVEIEQADLLEYAPVVSGFVGEGLPLRRLVEAMLQWSDNAAANLVVEELGGLDELQRGLRALGDRTTSVDRPEPDLNEAAPGDERDTTTPSAMARNLQRLLLGDALTPRRRELLRSMMLANRTGDGTIRAGVPSRWRVATATGTAYYGTRNDVAVVWSPRGEPIVLAVYTTHASADATPDDALVASATRIAVRALRR